MGRELMLSLVFVCLRAMFSRTGVNYGRTCSFAAHSFPFSFLYSEAKPKLWKARLKMWLGTFGRAPWLCRKLRTLCRALAALFGSSRKGLLR